MASHSTCRGIDAVVMAVAAACTRAASIDVRAGRLRRRQAPPADRKYLLERVDDAAVVQLYADGFDELPLDEKILIWHLYQAALAGRDIYLRPALRAQPRDARRARGDPHARRRASTRRRSPRSQRYTKLFWINTGPVQQPDGAQVRAEVHAGGVRGGGARPRRRRREVPAAAAARRSTAMLDAPAAALLRPGGRSDRHQQDARARARTSSRRAPTTSTSA